MTRRDSAAIPNFFIVGAPKCGTTTIASLLADHPEVYVPPAKELKYFGQDVYPERQIKTLDEYLDNFAGVSEKLRGEASPWYLYSEEAANEILELSPQAKIIIILRNPIEMVASNHGQNVLNRAEPILDLQEALRAEPFRWKGQRMPRNIPKDSRYIHGFLYMHMAHYARHIRCYQAVFGRESVHVIFLEELARNQAGTFAEVCRFLGIGEVSAMPQRRLNTSRGVRSRAITKMIIEPPRQLVAAAKLVMPAHIRRSLLDRIWSANIKPGEREPMPGHLRLELAERFADEVSELEKLLDVDLSKWLAGGGVSRAPRYP